MELHHAPTYFFQDIHPISIAVIGVGGTGSLVLTRLARLHYALQELGHIGLHVTAYDFDEVEPHNVGRQMFTQSDIGLNKATTLITKINTAFGTIWEGVPRRFDEGGFNIYLTCTDSASFRNDFDTYAKAQMTDGRRHDQNKAYYWMDFGNGNDKGQVVLSTINTESTKLPSVIDLFGQLEEEPNIPSCSMRESLKVQDLFINDHIALSGIQMLWTLLKDKYIIRAEKYVNLIDK